MDCRKFWELLSSETLKSSQLPGDGRLIISKIIDLEIKSKKEFECAHAKTKDNEDNIIENKGL